MTRDRVLGLEAVLPNGDVVSSMHKLVKNNTGYDVRQFFVGAEGTLGIVTKAVMRLIPQPTSHEVALLSLPDYICVLKLLNAAESMSALSAFELMYGDYYCAVTQSNPDGRPIPDTSQYYVLIETMGYTPGADRSVFEAFLAKAYEDGLATEIVLANSDAQRQSLWAIRESVDIAVRALAPILTYDVSLEVADIDDYVLGIRSALERRFPGWRMIVNGHIGDNNIHIGITTGPDTKEHESEVNDIVYKPLAHLHGSMSAEHGIGTTKNGYLGISRSQEEIGLMRQIKHAIDPSNLLNRKVLFDDEAGGSGKDPRVTPEQFNG
jgi:FAD/FMN-containing dehydrogenase